MSAAAEPRRAGETTSTLTAAGDAGNGTVADGTCTSAFVVALAANAASGALLGAAGACFCLATVALVLLLLETAALVDVAALCVGR